MSGGSGGAELNGGGGKQLTDAAATDRSGRKDGKKRSAAREAGDSSLSGDSSSSGSSGSRSSGSGEPFTSSSSSGSDSDGSSVERSTRGNSARSSPQSRSKKASPKSPRAKKPAKGVEDSSDSESGEDDEDGQPKRQDRSLKQELVSQVLARWWYCLPHWPPENFSYEKALTEKKLKWVEINDWEDLDDVDENGFTKVYQVSYFPGVFRDPSGKAIDVRPLEGKPCYSEMMKRSEENLSELLVIALEKQIAAMQFSPFWNTEATNLEKIRAKLKQALAGAKARHDKCRRRRLYLEKRRDDETGASSRPGGGEGGGEAKRATGAAEERPVPPSVGGGC